ncbi:MAG: hypothetical protein ACYCZW_02945 [Minisyncoccota bacterium]
MEETKTDATCPACSTAMVDGACPTCAAKVEIKTETTVETPAPAAETPTE